MRVRGGDGPFAVYWGTFCPPWAHPMGPVTLQHGQGWAWCCLGCQDMDRAWLLPPALPCQRAFSYLRPWGAVGMHLGQERPVGSGTLAGSYPVGVVKYPGRGTGSPGVYPGAHSGAVGVRGRGHMHCVVQGNGPSWGLQRACDALSACAPVVCCDLRRMAGPTRAPEALCLRVRAGVHCSTCHVVHSQPLEGQQPCADAQGTWTHTD